MDQGKLKFYEHIGRKKEAVDAAFWKGLYESGETGWDHGSASPGLMDFLEERQYSPGHVLVPGCGRGHDARALASAGFDVVAIDIVDQATEEARHLSPFPLGMEGEKSEPVGRGEMRSIQFECADYFDLPEGLRGPYDYLFEHTFFCAIDPVLRDSYVHVAASLLMPSGHLLGVFYNIQPETGPPFGATRAELIERFSPLFTLKRECLPRSFPNRTGKELLMLWQRR